MFVDPRRDGVYGSEIDFHGSLSCGATLRADNHGTADRVERLRRASQQKWTEGMKIAVEKGAEYYLERRMHKQGARHPPWYRFHYPVHYYTLRAMTVLGRLG